MTPALVLSNLAAVIERVRASDAWVARGLREPRSPANAMRQYARRGVRAGQPERVRAMLRERMTRQTPRAPQLIERALGVFDDELERITQKTVGK